MTERDDITLLREFAATESEAAFAELVQRHLGLVYSTALRSVGSNHAAEEISQAVFIILARKAKSLGAKTILAGWLHQTTRLTAANFLRGEIRRQKREQEAYMQSTLNEPDANVWPQIAPLLDDALGKLGERDRHALVLRFFENKSLAEVGAALGASEDAAKMRVNRALEKLRKLFGKRGVTLTATLIAGAVSASSVQAAPAGLAATISTVALTKGAAAGGSTLTLVKGALKIMAWTKVKIAIVVTAGVLLAVGTTTVAVRTGTHVPSYFRANHGFNGGFTKMVDLSKLDGFDAVRTIDDVARFASKVPGAVGFTAHPNFEGDTRYASAVLWYTKLSATELSWVLDLFDKKEAQKSPGEAPQAAAVAAAEAMVSGKMKEARELIDAGGSNGVKLVGDYDEKKALAFAVLRLGGSFEHTGQFAVGPCGACRNVVSGGNPSSCGLGVQGKKHWICCGSTNEVGHCQYWELIKAQDDSR